MSDCNSISIVRPDDWHLHVRDGDMLKAVAPLTARQFGRAIIMPNLVPPVTTVEEAIAYRDRILAATAGMDFTPLMTCYLTDNTDPDEIRRGATENVFSAVKLYPAGATTNSDSGVTDVANVSRVLEALQDIGLPLLVHGEVTDVSIDIFDREAVFIQRVLEPMLEDFPALKVVFEHITTSQAVDFVRAQGPRLGATITPHHLIINRNDIFKGGINPHMYCLPVAKREANRLALREAATSGDACFFLGTDSAPHTTSAKETACGCAGIFSAPSALELYAEVFDEEKALNNLESFASLNGPNFYGLDVNKSKVTLKRENWTPSDTTEVTNGDAVKNFNHGKGLTWKMVTD